MPSPIAAIDLIKTAMRLIGAIATGETPSAEETTDGLQALNDVLETWSTENLAVYGSNVEAFSTVAGQGTYTIGVGGSWNTPRPITIEGAYSTVSGVDFPIGMWTLAEYNSVAVKTQQQQIIERMVYINDYPLGLVILYPIPSSVVSVSIDAPRILTQVATSAATLTLPPGYARALQYAVAVELAPQYGAAVDVTGQARATKAIIKRANRTPRISGFDSTLTGGGRVVAARGY